MIMPRIWLSGGDSKAMIKSRYEYGFEWQIPQECVIHEASLKTLQDRGMNLEAHIGDGVLLRT
jgi:hypothetical protein